ncbi:hypothetical protein [Duganella violaceipulchra]|uniref:Pectate lyase superfamily protein domain-containing protein n=1 Tax=Duganella violaceipulchra TaxID=2849652 RepID=A0AA41LA23_9BURK|nr:hypothetical protein [Duganella violaceicalia]MBV6323815.1 hypothetical protein [Duganella violaceicalia]MCP2007506.1 hypothetical protein [Duganella violaceicalia]
MKKLRSATLFAALATAFSAQAQTVMTINGLETATTCTAPLVFISDVGREGLFYPVASNATDLANGGTTLFCNKGSTGKKMYKRMFDGAVNAKWFGLSESSLDNAPAVQAAINALRNGQELLIPEGYYKFQDTITLPGNKFIRFTARGDLTFGARDGIVVQGGYGHVLDVAKLHGIAWENTPAYGYTGSGITLMNASHATVTVNWVDGFHNAIKLSGQGHNGSQYNKIDFELLTHNDVGVLLTTESDGQKNWVNENTFTGGRMIGVTGLSAVPGSAQTDPFNGNKFYNFGFEGLTNGVDVDKFASNIFVAPRLMGAEGVANGFKFGPLAADNVIIATGLYEEAFVSGGVAGNAGVRTLLLGRLMVKDGVTSGVVNISDDKGRFLGLIRDANGTVSRQTKSRILPLATLPGVSP